MARIKRPKTSAASKRIEFQENLGAFCKTLKCGFKCKARKKYIRAKSGNCNGEIRTRRNVEFEFQRKTLFAHMSVPLLSAPKDHNV